MEPSYRLYMAPPPDQQAPELLAHSTTSLQQHPYKVYPAPQLPHLLQDSYEISRSAVSWNSEDLTTGSSASEAARWDQQRSASSKMSRASNVCVRCMELKVKCELGGSFSDDQTACQRCRSAQTECVFDFASQQDPRDTFKDEILARMTALEARMHRLEGRIAQIPLPLPGSTTSAPPAVETETASTSLEGRVAYFEAQFDEFGAPPHSHSEPPTPTSPFYPPSIATGPQHASFPPVSYPSVLQPRTSPSSAPSAPQHLSPYPQHQSWEHQGNPNPSTSPVNRPSPLPSPSHSSANDPSGSQDHPSMPVVYRPLTEIERRLRQPYQYPTVYVEGVQEPPSRGGEGWGS